MLEECFQFWTLFLYFYRSPVEPLMELHTSHQLEK